ncbi:MAG: hypothetical protein PPP58_02200 [Natronomonas sp.]
MKVDLTPGHDPDAVAAIVRSAFDAHPVHHHVGIVAPDRTVDERTALAAAARSRNITSSVADELRALEADAVEPDPSVPDRSDLRRRVAETGAELERLEERVATLRGRLQSEGTDDAAAAYRSAARRLSEAETEHLAAKERLEAARRRAREQRTVQEKRLQQADRRANLRRRARSELASVVRPAADRAVRSLPACAASTFEAASGVDAALAVCRIAALDAPVVLACDRFEDAASAADWLDAPVCRL